MDGDAAEAQRRARRKRGWDDREEEPLASNGPVAHATAKSQIVPPSSAVKLKSIIGGLAHAGPVVHPMAKTQILPPASVLALKASAGGGDGAGAHPAKDTSRIKKLCKFWGWGSCQRAFDCPFAHGVDELNQEGLCQELNLQILVEAEKDAASKGDLGKKLLSVLSAERARLAVTQEQLAAEGKLRQQEEPTAPINASHDLANRLMRDEVEKKVAQLKALRAIRVGKGASLAPGQPPPPPMPALPAVPAQPPPPPMRAPGGFQAVVANGGGASADAAGGDAGHSWASSWDDPEGWQRQNGGQVAEDSPGGSGWNGSWGTGRASSGPAYDADWATPKSASRLITAPKKGGAGVGGKGGSGSKGW